MNYGYQVFAYPLAASNGRRIRVASKVVRSDGAEVRFIEKLSKKQAVQQAKDYFAGRFQDEEQG